MIISTERMTLPWWEKYTLTIQEAAAYFGISDKTLRNFINEHKSENFILWKGTRPQIKRRLFEKYIDEELTAI